MKNGMAPLPGHWRWGEISRGQANWNTVGWGDDGRAPGKSTGYCITSGDGEFAEVTSNWAQSVL